MTPTVTGIGRPRALLAICLAALLPIALLSIVLVRVSSDAIRTQAESQVATSALASANAVEQELEQLATIVATYSELLSTRSAVESGDPEALRSLMRSLFDDRNQVSLAFVVDEPGLLLDVLPEAPEAIGVDFSFRDWYQGASSTGAAYISEAYQPQTDVSLTVVSAAPVFAANNPAEVIGYIGIGLTLIDLQSYVDEFAETQGVLLTVTDQSGVVVAARGGAPTSIESQQEDEAIHSALAGEDTQRQVERNGTSYLSATSSVDEFGWTVTAEVSTDDALAARRSIVTVAIFLAMVLALFVLVVLIRLSTSWKGQDLSANQRRESEAFLESIIENIPSVVTVKDAKTLTFVRANRAALELLQLKPEGILGLSTHGFAPKPIADQLQEDDRAVIEGRKTVVSESVEMGEQFGNRIVDIRQIPMIGPGGEVDYLLEIADDVTETLASFQQLEVAWADAKKADEAKSDFLSRMSHELRTPLNAVLGFGQLLEFEDLTVRQAESVQQILRGGRHLLGLINEVLDISRIESGNLSLSLEPVDLQPLITETIDLIRPLAAEAKVSVPEGAMPDWALWARGDQQRLRQILLNLLSNAVKYNDVGGSISIRCHAVDDRRLRISVADTGHGLSQDQVERLFSPFERLGAEGSDIEGTGLGLALTKRLVEAMHGTIGLETALGIGSTFWVELGLSHESDLATGAPVGTVGFERVENVARLIHVEDSLEQLRSLEDLVSAHPDVELISIADAETAMDMAIRFQPDVMLLDLGVSGVDAAELLGRLTADAATSSIVVVTICDSPTDITGMHRHLVRPMRDVDLLSAMTDALAVARALSY